MKAHQFIREMQANAAILGRHHGISVVFEGDKAGTDGKTITLPQIPMDADLKPAQVRAMRGYVDHEAGHLRHSDMPRIISFYDKCFNNDKSDLKVLHNNIEDVWMEREVLDEYQGSLKNLSEMGTLSCQQTRKALDKEGVPSFDIKDIELVGWNLKCGWRKDFVGTPAQEFWDAIPEEYLPLMEKFLEETLKCENSEDAITLAKSIYKLLKEEDEESLKEMDPEDFDAASGAGEDEGENSEDFEEREAAKGNDTGQSSGKSADGEDLESALGKAMNDLAEALHSEDPHNTAGGGIGAEGKSLGGTYKVASTQNDVEYHRNGDSSKGYDNIHKIVNSCNYSKYTEVRNNVGPAISIMSSKLKRAVLAQQKRDWERNREDGKLDTKSIVRAFQRKPDVFKVRKDRDEHDTAITILCDLSGSMGGSKAKVATECAVAVSECLEHSGITFNVVGFSNRGSAGGNRDHCHRVERLDTVYFKDFHTPLRTARASIAQLEDAVGGNNTDYDFIVNALTDLEKRPEKRKILLVFSDGHPASGGMGTRRELMDYCAKAIKDGNKKGIETLGIGVCDSAVEGIYPKNVVVHSVQDLSTTVFSQLTKMLVKEVKKR